MQAIFYHLINRNNFDKNFQIVWNHSKLCDIMWSHNFYVNYVTTWKLCDLMWSHNISGFEYYTDIVNRNIEWVLFQCWLTCEKSNFDLSFMNRFKWKTYFISNHFLLISNYFEFTLLSKVKFMIRLKMLKFNLLFE